MSLLSVRFIIRFTPLGSGKRAIDSAYSYESPKKGREGDNIFPPPESSSHRELGKVIGARSSLLLSSCNDGLISISSRGGGGGGRVVGDGGDGDEEEVVNGSFAPPPPPPPGLSLSLTKFLHVSSSPPLFSRGAERGRDLWGANYRPFFPLLLLLFLLLHDDSLPHVACNDRGTSRGNSYRKKRSAE